MPQGSKRSTGYRSFIRCDDPKGVVECGTIRISKIPTQRREYDKIDEQRKQNKLDDSLAEKEKEKEMGIGRLTGEVHSPTSFQLMQVSRGAQKLNHVIDSCSDEKSHDKRPSEVAKDLLKGAVHLWESLVVLRRLQEASKYMPGSAKKQKKKLEGGVDDMGIRAGELNQFRDDKYHLGLQSSQISADGSSRNSFGELKKAIRESLVKQNAAPDPSTQELCYHRKLDTSDVPSTSSSQSTTVHSSNFPSSDSISSTASQKKAKHTSLIANLMGLQSLPSSPRKQMRPGKLLSMRNPIFDIDFPMTERPQTSTQKADRKARTLDEILETMKFKGLLKRDSVNGMTPNTHHSDTFHSKERCTDDKPPIVIIKPLRFSCVSLEEPVIPKSLRDGVLDSDEILMKLRSRGEPPFKTINCEASNSNNKCREVKVNATPVRNMFYEGAHRKEVGEKPEGTHVKAREKGTSIKRKACIHGYHKSQKNQTADKKPNEVQKATSNRKKGEEKKPLKSANEIKSQDHSAKVTPSKLRTQKDEANVMKNQIFKQQSTNSRHISKDKMQKTLNSSSNWKRIRQGDEKTVLKKQASTGCKGANEDIKGTRENKSTLSTVGTSSREQPLRDGVDASQIQIRGCLGETILMNTEVEDLAYHQNDNVSFSNELASLLTNEDCTANHHGGNENSVCRIISIATQKEEGFKSEADAEIGCQNVDHHFTQRESLTATRKLKALLLRTPSFLRLAEELFDLEANRV
ncbi:hypothetical protein Nepgr_019876 [Nepenthes gracilis]|uniref:Uncharacterized protein n=1 Tax=Nepenthes gracilis TaxID=150966 RepID=A0AAD3SUD5_NEPGR|nr:hypothetical protein Nepgr_019876 [Nepenthes gracilis]